MASTNHQETSATAANTSSTNMTNQSTSHQANSLVGVQRQQQELIKLLAQHFHNQFYQLANNGTTNGQQFSSLSSNTNRFPTNIAQYQLHQYQAAQRLSTFSVPNNRADLNTMNLLAHSGQQHHNFLPNHTFRSHPTNTTNSGNIALGLNMPEPCVDFSTTFLNDIQTSTYPPTNDMNIFNALGLNLINNQLVLSHQHQQSLVQAATNTKQYESRNQLDFEQQQNRRGPKDAAVNNVTDHEDNQHQDGKELLKFSINTILGRGSPKSTNSTVEDSRGDDSTNQTSSEEGKGLSSCEQATRLMEANNYNRDEQLRVLECDPAVEFGSDISSVSTPIPQTSGTSSSILFNQPIATTDHHSANYNNNVGLANSPNQQTNAYHQPPHPAHHPGHPPPLSFLTGSTAFPWTVAARGKPRRGMMRRAVFSDSQRVGLEKRFQLQKYISKPDRKKLAEKLGLRDSQVKIWFQNRRMKWRNSKERELLSAGGSREQTLPTRNNPNPDLSDVGETVKRMASTLSGSSSNNSLSK